MEVGQPYKLKIGAIIQARMNSQRLPQKVLLPLPYPDGKPILGLIIDQLKKTQSIDQVIVATTTHIADDPIETFLKQYNISCYRGDEQDVFSRFYDICQQEQLDLIIRLTADNPVIDHRIIEQTIAYHLAQQQVYTRSTGWPLGMNIEVLSGQDLLAIESAALSEYEKEHVTPYFRREHQISNELAASIDPNLAKLRLTIDYPADYAMFSILLARMQKFEEKSPLAQIKKVLETTPWVFEINRHLIQKKSFLNRDKELEEAVELLDKLDMSESAEFLRQAVMKK